MKNIAIIPARSGSKGLIDKNIKPFNGRPLIAYTIDAARESGLFTEIHVSTDSQQYAQIARQFGAQVPFLRDAFLAGDTADSWAVVRAVLNRYEQDNMFFDTVALLQPTSPLREALDIRAGYALMKEREAEAVVAVCEAEHAPILFNQLPPDGSMDGFVILPQNANRQALGNYYRINGALYIVQTAFIKSQTNIYQNGCFAYIMPKERSVDIDDITDFTLAEFLARSIKHS